MPPAPGDGLLRTTPPYDDPDEPNHERRDSGDGRDPKQRAEPPLEPAEHGDDEKNDRKRHQSNAQDERLHPFQALGIPV